jgi:hypothetical protein
MLAMAFAGVTHVAAREEVIRSIDWKALAAARAITSGVVTADGAASNLRVTHKGPSEGTFHLVTIDKPAIRSARYAIRGRVKYQEVAAGSYLELLNYIGEGAYFSRTLGDGGPMGRLSGSSTWREFILPFMNQEGGPPPSKLVVNLVLKGGGTVEISPLELVQFSGAETMTSAGWWSDRQAGLVGGMIGSLLAILGAAIGALASAGRAKTFVLGTLRALALLGLVSLVAGVVAVVAGQPYAVFYPLLLIGAISTAVGFTLPRVFLKRYEQLELRRMQALDA